MFAAVAAVGGVLPRASVDDDDGLRLSSVATPAATRDALQIRAWDGAPATPLPSRATPSSNGQANRAMVG